MNFWFNLKSTDEPINNTNYINNKELQISEEEIELIKNVLKILTNDLIPSDITSDKNG